MISNVKFGRKIEVQKTKKHRPNLCPSISIGSPHWKHSELLFEKKALIPVLQQLLVRTKGT